MAGKASLIMILGFSLIFIVMGYFWGDLATRSVDNHSSYYKNTIAHNIAVSGANLALRHLLEDDKWTTGLTRSFENGTMDVTINPIILDTALEIISIGHFMDVDKTVKVKLWRSTFAKYAWFISAVSTGGTNKRTWITGDTVWGGFHSNQTLNIDGDPVFFGKVSTSGGVKMTPGSHPEFLGGIVQGVDVEWDQNMKYLQQKAAATAGMAEGGSCVFDNINLWLTFYDNGDVSYRTAAKSAGDDSSKYSAPIRLPLTTLAPTGIIYLDKGDIYMSGTVNGQVTVVSDQSSGTGGGNVYFVGDVVYETPAMIYDVETGGYLPNEACDDLMGIMTTNNVNISSSVQSGGYHNNIENIGGKPSDIHIDAGIFSRSGGFNLIDLKASMGPTGSIYLTGSMTAGKEELVAIYDLDGYTLLAGYNRHVVLDERFLVRPPLWFPFSTGYEVMSWLE